MLTFYECRRLKAGSKKPRRQSRRGFSMGKCICRLANGGAGNALDFRTGNAEVRQFAVRHAVEFDNGLTILTPVIKRASDVHGLFPSLGFGNASGCLFISGNVYMLRRSNDKAQIRQITHAFGAWRLAKARFY
jgi:hypothetical protein